MKVFCLCTLASYSFKHHLELQQFLPVVRLAASALRLSARAASQPNSSLAPLPSAAAVHSSVLRRFLQTFVKLENPETRASSCLRCLIPSFAAFQVDLLLACLALPQYLAAAPPHTPPKAQYCTAPDCTHMNTSNHPASCQVVLITSFPSPTNIRGPLLAAVTRSRGHQLHESQLRIIVITARVDCITDYITVSSSHTVYSLFRQPN
ncbi:hypothetical protein FOVSG1_007998 [Fusarium oxysporum f. sp. vasinfectum]